MKIVCKKNNLIDSINIALKAVSSKSTKNILECIVIDVQDTIKLIANDMELGIETILEGQIIEKGSIAISAKFFSEIIRKLPDDVVTIETDYDYRATISCANAKFNIVGKNSEEFPFLPNVSKNNAIKISQFALKEIIKKTAFSISLDENNKIMTGELFEINGSLLRLASLDGHRISICKIELNNEYDYIKVIIPGKTLIDLSKIIGDDADKFVDIYILEKHILFEFENTIVLSRLIEGNFFKIDQMLSSDYESKVIVNRLELLNCIERSMVIIRDNEQNPLIFNIGSDNMEIMVATSVGSMNERLSIVCEGTDVKIGFNPKFFIDALKVIEDEYINIYLSNSRAPGIIKDKKENYTYLILPVNTLA